MVKDKDQNIALVKRAYDEKGRLTSETDANGTSQCYVYDGLDRCIELTVRNDKENILSQGNTRR